MTKHVAIKSVYFGNRDADVLDWVRGQNFSHYVKDLIRRQMQTEKEGIDADTLDLLTRAIEARLAGRLVAPAEEATGTVQADMLRGLF